MIIWAEIWCWTWSECGCGRVVYCHECKCWLVPRSDLMDHHYFFDMIVKQGHLKTHIESVQAKVEYIHVICVNIKLQHREFWRLIMNQSMKMSSTLVISVNIKENNRDIWILILNQSIRKSDIIVFNAIKNLEHRDIWRFTLNHFSFPNGKSKDTYWVSSWENQVSL